MSANAKVPPVPVVRAVGGIREAVHGLHRRMVPPQVAMLELIMGSMITQAVYVAAKLGIADVLADGPLSAKDIADKVEANPDAVDRLLRALSSQGVFRADGHGRYELTPMASALRSDAEVSMRSVALMTGSPEHWEHWGHLIDSVRDGEPSVAKIRGMGVWDYLEHNHEFGEIFNDAMTNVSAMVKAPVLAAYDFSGFRKIIDVGGGHGGLLAGILQRAPQAEGILFDLPAVTAGADELLREHGVRDRCAIESGSFFDGVPAGGDAYVMKTVIHDWPEDEALTILRNIRAAIDPAGRLLLVEFVVPDGNRTHPAKVLDLEMLLVVGGRERTEAGYRELLAKAGFTLTRVVRTAAPLSVVEAVPAV